MRFMIKAQSKNTSDAAHQGLGFLPKRCRIVNCFKEFSLIIHRKKDNSMAKFLILISQIAYIASSVWKPPISNKGVEPLSLYGLCMASFRILGVFTVPLFILLSGSACTKEDAPTLPKLPDSAVVLAIGDSLTNGVGAGKQSNYPAVLSRLISRRVVNAGVNGETSEGLLDRLEDEIDEHRPMLIILCIGGNDFLRRNPKEVTKGNIDEAIEILKEERLPVVLIAVPSGLGLGLEPDPLYLDLAKKHDIPILKDALSELLSSPSKKSDTIHLNSTGYKELAEAVAELLEESGAI